MKGVTICVSLLAMFLLLLASPVLAGGDEPPPAPDGETVGEGGGDVDGMSTFNAPGSYITNTSVISNGAFDNWIAGLPANWTLWRQDKPGWEEARPLDVDLALTADGMNNSLGWFVRNVGGSGSYSAGAYQVMDELPAPGYYFVNISESIFADPAAGPYNAVAWYAISEHEDPAMVEAGDWRELDPFWYQCPNDQPLCTYVGRDETVWIEPGWTFHVMVSQKFPHFNTWSLFIIDDISVVAADPDPTTNFDLDAPNGYYVWLDWQEVTFWGFLLDADEKCHYLDEWCVPFVPTMVYIPQ
jgi:hypothetical protein